jgi:hypothetical protein
MNALPSGEYAIARQAALLHEADEARLARVARRARPRTSTQRPARRVAVETLLSRLATRAAR